ncbi:hypothetical protein KFK09_027450 [Dendrobium nobile]|uniref:Uncharacterized protein n=1 Tax=Dendrobium nobile TaxID=94219 RepID=A0A8T3AAV3_DENNO|nr:hypothetical protein KFK09_027450 [Dendrobium nobile]
MDDEGLTKELLQNRIEHLEHERDELRKDIEQLCMQQAGPSYIAIATRMHFQRTSGLEQEIENLKKKLAGCLREKQNIQEELSEAYRIKAQLAELHNAEVLKNKGAEDQLKFFQGCVAAAYSERDHSLMESEKAKDREESMAEKLSISERRLEELETAYHSEKERHVALENELGEIKEKVESFEKVVNKFYAIRQQDVGASADHTWQSRCSCLLDDSSDKWIFNSDGRSATSTYIASLEEEIESRKKAMEKLQNNLRMGLQIEQHLRRSAGFLEKKQMQLIEMFESGLSSLRHIHNQLRADAVKLLEEEASHLEAVLLEVHEKLLPVYLNSEPKQETFQAEGEHLSDDNECKDVHITDDVVTDISSKGTEMSASGLSSRMHDASDALSQALQEKVAALLLLSQQEERHLLEREMNAALQQKMEELQRNLSQVTVEKIEALMELAQLKREYQMLHDRHVMKCDHLSADSFDKSTTFRERIGTLTNFSKKTSWKRWMSKDYGTSDSNVKVSSENNATANENHSMDFARLKVENAALKESMLNLEHLTSSVHRLHVSILKVRDDSASIDYSESLESLKSIMEEANQVKTALGSSLPVSWSADPTVAAITYDSLSEPPGGSSEERRSDRVVCTAEFEMVELLILAAQFFKEKIAVNTSC